MASCTRFSRDICRNVSPKYLEIKSAPHFLAMGISLLDSLDNGRDDVANLKSAKIEIGGGISLVLILPLLH